MIIGSATGVIRIDVRGAADVVARMGKPAPKEPKPNKAPQPGGAADEKREVPQPVKRPAWPIDPRFVQPPAGRRQKPS